ncbi:MULTISPECIES: hypothetical protein [Nocardioides]|uniref:Uncharacterized protein n=1 Tax=Nocardioides vastitatis TaxID=2568655 RepID=A0ABW0ZHH9_9ACTN|nr:hypothetical protein [Nocardioides sp.]THI96227.1 hypothetical protein E7Z54_17355 [Nocardioides sp.]
MRPGRLPLVIGGALCLGWLSLTTGYGAAAGLAPSTTVDLGGQDLPGGGLGSTAPDRPTPLQPGLWADVLGGSTTKNAHHFSYQRRIQNSTVHVGVLGAPQTAESDLVSVAAAVITDGVSEPCGSAQGSSTYSVPQAVIGAEVIVAADDPDDTESPCLRAETVQIVVSRGSSSNVSEIPVAIKVVEEAPVSAPAGLPPADEEVSFDVPEPGTPREAPGAPSFDAAPQLDPSSDGVTVSTRIEEGTEQLWRVGVQWGQQLVVRATAPGVDQAAVDELGCCGGVPLRVHLVGPSRSTFAHNSLDTSESNEGAYAVEPDAVADLVAGTPPLRYLNRYDDTRPVLPGDYWIGLSAAPVDENADRDPVEVPVELTVAVTGQVEGEPSYQQAVLSPSGGPGPGGYSPEQPFLVADDTFAAVASGNPVVLDAEGSWLDGRRWAGLGLGIASIACLAGGLWRLRAAR